MNAWSVLKVLLAVPVLTGMVGAQVAERFPWMTSLDQARIVAASEQKPLLILFRCEP